MEQSEKEAIEYAIETMESVARDIKDGISVIESAQRLKDEAEYLADETINK